MPRIAWLFLINMIVIFCLMGVLGLRINISESYPLGVYQRTSDDYRYQSFVEACLPRRVSNLMVDRGYIPGSGSCGGYPPVIKRVYGLEGDVVEIFDRVHINGVEIANTTLNSRDDADRSLTPTTSTRVSPDHVWLMSDHHSDSYDSRYFGPIPTTLIRSTLEPLWTSE